MRRTSKLQSLFNNMDEQFETDVDEIHHCYYSINQDDVTQDDVTQDETEDMRRWGIAETIHEEHTPSNRQSLAASVVRCAWICFLNTIVCGTIVGIIATILWWLDLNLGMCCYGYTKQRDKMPVRYKRIRLTAEIVEGVIIQFWSFSCLCGAFEWSTLTRLNLPVWNIIAAYTDAVCRLFLYVYRAYDSRLKSYICNVIFLAITTFNYIKIARNHRSTVSRRYSALSLSLKLSLQFLIGFAMCLFFNYWFLGEFRKSHPLVKAVLASVLPIIFAIPKFLTTFVHARLEGVYSPGKAVMFTVGFQVSTTLACRLLQANNENFVFFILISFVHSILNVIDKLLQPVRDGFSRCVCPSRRTRIGRSARASRLIADKTLVNMMTETSAIVMSSASFHIITYYYIRDSATGLRVNGYTLLEDMVKRVGFAILIEYFFTTIALVIQTHRHNIPVIKVWVLKWKWILCMHLVQVIFAMLYFPGHIDDVTLTDQLSKGNDTIGCLGPFERF